MGWWPCDCCVDCVIASDDFNRDDASDFGSDAWSIRSGTWAIDTLKAKCTSPGIATHDTGATDPSMMVKVRVKIPANGDKARAILLYTGATSWYAAELTAGPSGTLKLVDDDGNVLSTTGYSATAGNWYEIVVCFNTASGYDDDILVAKVRAYGFVPWDKTITALIDAADLPTGPYYGGIGATASGTYYEDFAVKHTEDSLAGCEKCYGTQNCTYCTNGSQPVWAKITMPTMSELTEDEAWATCCPAASGKTFVMDVYGFGTSCKPWGTNQFVCLGSLTISVALQTRDDGGDKVLSLVAYYIGHRWRVDINRQGSLAELEENPVDCNDFNNLEMEYLGWDNWDGLHPDPWCTIDGSAYFTSLA